MKNIKKVWAVLYMLFTVATAVGQNWALTNGVNGEILNAALTDSITYEKSGTVYLQKVWRDGKAFSTVVAETGMKMMPQNTPLEYQVFTAEEDGTDAVWASDGSYAILYEQAENEKFTLVSGILGCEDREYVILDKDGYLENMVVDGEMVSFSYMPNQLWIIDQNGKVKAQIPYSYFDDDANAAQKKNITRASGLSRNPIYNALTLNKKIKNYLKSPIKSFCSDLLRHFSEGAYRRYGGLLNDLIDAGLDLTDLANLLTLAERLNEVQFFGNASITTLPANVDFFDAKLSCEVAGLPSDKHIWYQFAKESYIDLLDYNFELSMELCDNVAYSSSLEKQSKNISSDGKQTFPFTVDKIDHTYFYEPALKLTVTIEVDAQAAYKACVGELPSGSHEIPEGKTRKQRSCTIYGNRETFYTPGIGCSILSVENVADNSADIKCSFSEVPDNANNYVYVKNIETGSMQRVSARKILGEQTINVGGLEPCTKYEAYCVIYVNGQTFLSRETKTFTTNPPDISGTWTCVETYYKNGNYSNPQYRTYTIVLNKNGKAEVNNGEDFSSWEAFDGWSWELYGNTLQMQCTLIATQTQNTGEKIKGTVDNLNDPKKITGRRFNWNFNQYGYFESDGWEIVMTR